MEENGDQTEARIQQTARQNEQTVPRSADQVQSCMWNIKMHPS